MAHTRPSPRRPLPWSDQELVAFLLIGLFLGATVWLSELLARVFTGSIALFFVALVVSRWSTVEREVVDLKAKHEAAIEAIAKRHNIPGPRDG